MASQLSSLAIDGVFSKLPEHLIHRIFSLLPCIKDAVRTSAVSKSFLQAWHTFPIPKFDLAEFVPHSNDFPDDEVEAKTQQFIRFVDDSLRRFGKQNGDGNGDGMKKFDLTAVSKMDPHFNRWIGMALDNRVRDLALLIFIDGFPLSSFVPERVFSADWLKSLKLVGPTIYLPLDENSSTVHLSSLTNLHLRDSAITDKQLRKLLCGSPNLESIALLDCESLSKVEIFDHPNLEMLDVTVSSTDTELTAIRVRAPKLKSFGYACECLYKRRDVFVEVHGSPPLKCLRISDWKKSDKWFHQFLANFPLLEILTIDWCNELRRIRILNPLLEIINIQNCNNLEDVLIDSKKVSYFFLFSLHSSMPKPSVRLDNPPCDCVAKVIAPFKCDILLDAKWYSKLKEFLTRSLTYKKLHIFVHPLSEALSGVDGDIMGKGMHKKLPSAACKIQELTLGVANVPLSCHSYILNGSVSACHPTMLTLFMSPDCPFVKFVCKELADVNKKSNRKCWCKGKFKCWKHQLKGVEVEQIKGIKLLEQNLGWDALFDLLPTLEVGNDIYLKLLW